MMKNRRGSVAAMSAFLMVGVVGVAGLAIDLTRVWLVSARLKTSVDAAALVAVREITSPTRDPDARALFLANFTQNGAYPNTAVGRYLGAALITPNDIQITNVGTRQVSVTARARVGTTLFGIISPGTTDVEETTVAERQGSGLELAIALDATISMLEQAPQGGTKLEAAQAATRTLIDILFGRAETQNNLWVSVLSFSRVINIGSGNTNLLDQSNAPFDFIAARWGGCVRARADDTADLDPAVNGLPPYWWTSTFGRVGTVENGDCDGTERFRQRRFFPATAASGGRRFCQGDNDWGSGQTLQTGWATRPTTRDWPTGVDAPPGNATRNPRVNLAYSYWRTFPELEGESDLNTAAAGPNHQCSVQPIVPLTARRTDIVNAVNAITVQGSSGTITPAGLHGAWYTLSPRWQNRWPGIASGGPMGTLPLAYNTRNMTKSMIILTDGANVWAPSSQLGVRGSATRSELLYGYYGRAADFNAAFPGSAINIEGLDDRDAIRDRSRVAIDSRFTAICNAIKATGINIYIVGFEVPDAARETLLQNCATRPTSPFYVRARDASELDAAFRTIGSQLTGLRLVQ